jgi:hypothetical protein
MPFDELELLFDDLTHEPTTDQINSMLNHFLNDFVTNPFQINDVDVIVKVQPSWNRWFRGKPETFVHLITRESKYRNGREFDHLRANRIHWVKPILLNHASPRIKYFEYADSNKVVCNHYWLEEKDFMVVVKPIHPDFLVITAFCIDSNHEKQRYRGRFNEFYKGKKNALR